MHQKESLLQDVNLDCFRTETVAAIATFLKDIHEHVFDESEIIQIKSALTLMLEVHAQQKPRSDNTPYVEHPLSVATLVLRVLKEKDVDVIIASLLHDAVEDQASILSLKLSEPDVSNIEEKALLYIEKTFGKRVAEIVRLLTNPTIGITPENRNEKYAEHVKFSIQDPDVALIKYFDFASNAMHLEQVADTKRRNYLIVKYSPIFQYLIERFENTETPINIDEESRLNSISLLKQKYLEVQTLLIS